MEKLVRFLEKNIRVFWSQLNSYSRFAIIPAAKLMSGDSSSSTFHDFQEFIIFNYQQFRNSEFQTFKNWTLKVSKISKFLSCRIRRKMFPIFSRDVPWFFLDLIQVFWSNKMKKYGLPEPQTPMIHEMLSFRPLMPWNRHFISSIWRRKIQLRH